MNIIELEYEFLVPLEIKVEISGIFSSAPVFCVLHPNLFGIAS
jgi:hypothetical protein